MLGYINSSIVKCEVEDVNDNVEKNLVEMEVNSYYSAGDLQNNTSLEKSKEHIVSSSFLKSSTPKHQGINRISIETPDNSDIKHLCNAFYKSKDLAKYQIPVKVQTPVFKSEPLDKKETIEETVVGLHYSLDDSQTTSNSYNMVKVKNSVSKNGSQSTNSNNVVKVKNIVTPLLLKKSTSKCQGINKISLRTTNNVKQSSKSKHLGTNEISVKVQTPTVKIEPEDVNNSIKKSIVKKEVKSCYSADSLNYTSKNRSFVKDEIRLSSLLKNSAAKRRTNNKKSVKATENGGVKPIANNFHFEPKKMSNNQISVKLATTIIKHEPEDFNDTSKENIEMVTNPSYSSNSIKSTAVSHSLVKIDQIVSSPKGFTSQHQSTNNSIKATDNSKNHLIHNINYKPKDLGNNLTSVKYKIPIIKREPDNDKSTIQPNALINLKSEIETKFVDPNEIHSSDLINGNAESQEVILKNMVTIESSIKTEDIDSQTDKKKISWEEFRAKREKMGLINISGNICIY